MRYGRAGHRLDQRRAEPEVLGDIVRPTRGATCAPHEQQWSRAGVDELDELDRLAGLLDTPYAPGVGEYPQRVPVQLAPAGDEAGAVPGLELVELAAVEHPGEQLAGLGRADA